MLGVKEEVEFIIFFLEFVYVCIYYIVRVKDNNVEYDVKEIEKNIIELIKIWNDRLVLLIFVNYGEVFGKVLECKYNNVFFCSYMEYNLSGVVFVDIGKFE